ncbi:ABC transporter permease subunit (plasmid) [Sinorhizobium meliloti]|nr:ABC transporter permease subunit [Sinorhizobium meliloti]
MLLTVGAALNQLTKNVEVASSVLGAGTFRIFLQVVLPGLRPAIVSALLRVSCCRSTKS